MDKNAIKKYAVWARNELIARVTQKAEQYEITEKKTTPKDADSIGGRLLTEAEKNQRKALIEKIQVDGFEQVMEEVAYTWFNRFTALRFMEVNNYLPSHTRVFTNDSGEFKPQILADAIQLDLEGLNMDKVFELKDANKTEELYKYLLITQCNALSGILPRMFQKIEHYTELLLPDYLLREGSVIEQMIALIPEEDWTDQVQIIGWLYQYYNSEPKDAVFVALKKNVKISKENIPAATQLFTPDWIVRYMVENSLGRLWLEGHPNDALKSEWKYYLDEAEQEAEVQKQLDKIRKEYAALKPEEIRCIDPCMGSGHILCYMFDVLVKIYEDYGYTAREAVENIVDKNLWGLDIDERAAQLAYFAVMMKARQYDRRFFNKKDENGELCIPQPHVYAIEESNGITSAPMHDMGIGLSQEEYGRAVKEALRLVEEMHDAKEYGSIIHVTPCDWDLLRRFAVPRGADEGQMMLDIHGEIEISERLQMLINIGEVLAQQYNIVVTNPPYMGSGGMNAKLLNFIKKKYPNGKTDLFSCFIERCLSLSSSLSFVAMITMESWMFLSSFEELRKKIVATKTLTTMVHMPYLGKGGTSLGINFGTAMFVFRRQRVRKYRASFNYIRYFEIDDDGIPFEFPTKNERMVTTSVDNFELIPGSPIAYWASDAVIKCFREPKTIDSSAYPRQGLATGNNDKYLRMWNEVSIDDIEFSASSTEEFFNTDKKYIPYNKGGAYRKWFADMGWVIRFDRPNYNVLQTVGNHLPSKEFYCRESITWSKVTSSKLSMRYIPKGSAFDVAGCSIFADENLEYILAFANSAVMQYLMHILSQTMNYEVGNVKAMPLIVEDRYSEEIIALTKRNILISKEDLAANETSFYFKRHPLIKNTSLISNAFMEWEKECALRFEEMKKNEERINSIFISIYGLEKELSFKVEDEDVSVQKANLKSSVKGLISYAVGCMFGRYSLDSEGIVFAGGNWNPDLFRTYPADKDAIIPISDDEYFDDDIVNRFVKFIEIIYGKETLEENLNYIARAIGGEGNSRSIIRKYFLDDFFSDHCSMYTTNSSGKRPIYWLFDSGKRNGFKCLVYMHRYHSDTIARIRTDYVHEQQSRYRTAITDLENRIGGAVTSERVKLNKRLEILQAQSDEIRVYEEKIHHLADQMISIDLDDGVKHNYEIFKDVLAKIK